LHGFDTVVVVRLAGENHHLAGKTSLAETPEGSQPADSRHPEVEQHHVERLLRDALQCRLSVRSRFHEMSRPSETVLHHEAERLVVVDNQHAHTSVQCVTRSGAHRSTGSSNSTVVPLPTPALSARILPPCCSMNDWQIARPSPTPCPMSFVVKNGSNTCGRCSAATPSAPTLRTSAVSTVGVRSRM